MVFKDFLGKAKKLFSGDDSVSEEDKSKIAGLTGSPQPSVEETAEQPANIQDTPQSNMQAPKAEEQEEITAKPEEQEDSVQLQEEAASEPEIQEMPKPTERLVMPSKNENASRFIHLDFEKLELDAIERESETITAYHKLLAKDIAIYNNTKQDEYILSIEKKYKMILGHAIELKTLLSNLNELLYEYLTKSLAENHEARALLEKGSEKLNEIVGLLNKVALYDEMFNPEKAHENYKQNIISEIEKSTFLKEVEVLSMALNQNINNKKTGITTNVVIIMHKLQEK